MSLAKLEKAEIGKAFIEVYNGKDWQTLKTKVDKVTNTAYAFTNNVQEYRLKVDLEYKGNNAIPDKYSIDQNYPNPFNPITNISFNLPVNSDVSLVIYNVLGQKIKTLVKGQRDAGDYTVTWDATNETGSKVSSGIYFYQITSGSFNQTRKMVLIK